MIHENTLRAYREIIASGLLGDQELKVLNAIRVDPGRTRNELSTITGIKITSVCGRVTRLKDLNMIHEKPGKGRRSVLFFGGDPDYVPEPTDREKAVAFLKDQDYCFYRTDMKPDELIELLVKFKNTK